MTDRGSKNRTGDAGEAIVKAIVTTQGDWIAREQRIDVGIDLEAELDAPEAFGAFLKLQVKATAAPPPTTEDGFESISVKKTFLRYAHECRLPVILVRVWIADASARYIWVQEWIDSNWDTLALDAPTPARVTVRIPSANTLKEGLRTRLRDIAKGTTPFQFRSSLRDLARLAVSHHNTEAVERLGDLIVALGRPQDIPIEEIIDEMVTLSTKGLQPGQIRGLWEFHDLIPMLTRACRAFAPHFTASQVVRLVSRDDSYSRAAMYGLSVLYDSAPDHMTSLGLPAIFEDTGHIFLAFYCLLRDQNPGITSLDLAMSDRPLENAYGIATRDDRFLNRWANRGDAALHDFFTCRCADCQAAGETH